MKIPKRFFSVRLLFVPGSLKYFFYATSGKYGPLGLLCAVLFLAVCSKDYDPFTDLTNAKVHVLSWDFHGNDSLALYTTATLKVVVALRDEVDSFDITALKNRFWTDGKTVIRKTPTTPISNSPYTFSISFFDTGLQHIVIRTYRSNHEIIPQDLSIRVYTPLRQEKLTEFFGQKISLKSPNVGDTEIFYHWKFGSIHDSSVSPTLQIAVPVFNPDSGVGSLWVTDFSGRFATPRQEFRYAFGDTTHPSIICRNAGLQGDTILSRDTMLVFKVKIIDSLEPAVESCSVNKSPFDFVNSTSHEYTKLFRNLPELTKNGTPLRLDVFAVDDSLFNNRTAHTFWALFTPEGSTTSDMHLEFLQPRYDGYFTANHECPIWGNVQSFRHDRHDTIVVKAAVNGSTNGQRDTTFVDSGKWIWVVKLPSAYDTVTVIAFNRTSGAVDSVQRIVIYSPDAHDTIAPMIYEISVDGRKADSLDTNAASVLLRVAAFDDHLTIKSLKIQGNEAKPDSSDLFGGSYVFIWSSQVGPLAHWKAGNKISVIATDMANNSDTVFVTIFNNTPPVIQNTFVFPTQFCSDSADTVLLPLFDADNDKISVNTISKPANMAVSSAGEIIWKPTNAVQGSDSLVLSITDSIPINKKPQYYQWNFTFDRCTQPLPAVRFVTSSADFPSLLQAIADTLRVTLSVDSTRLLPTLRFSARFSDNGKKIVDTSASPNLIWTPTDADTGKRRLVVTLLCGGKALDSISPVITIVPKNKYPCSLSYRFTGIIDSNHAIDLFSHPAPETLYFSIQDKDNIATEKYTVTITQHAVSAVETITNRSFYVALQTDSTKTTEALSVRVTDLTGTKDSAVFTIKYSQQPDKSVYRVCLNTTARWAGVSANVLKFPVLVRLTKNNFNFASAQGHGENIRFRKSNGAAAPYQIEQWDSAAGNASLWVLADTVYGNDSSHYLELYKATRPAIDGSNSPAVFAVTNGFQGVWHCSENGGTLYDATANAINGSISGSQQVDSGIVGNGQYYDGNNSYTDFGNKLNPGASGFTASLWVKRNGNLNTYNALIGKSAGGIPNMNYGWLLDFDDMDRIHGFMANATNWPYYPSWGSIGTFDIYSNATITDITQWHYVCMVINRAGNNGCKLYIDGAEAPATINGNIATVNDISTTVTMRIGAEADDHIFFKGFIDEAIVSFSARSTDWIKLCYMNQKASDALVVIK